MVQNEICDMVRYYTDRHVQYLESHGRSDMAWRTLYTYTKMDIPCCEVPGLTPIVQDVIEKVKAVIGFIFGEPRLASLLAPRSWKEPHLLKYQQLPNLV